MDKKVSIVIYTYNGGKYLQKAIDGCLNQTYQNIEIIVVDDGSTEVPQKIYKTYADNARVTVIYNSKVKSLGSALNQGFAKATGDYFTWIKDIDYLKPNAVEAMLSFISASANTEIVYADYSKISVETGEERLHLLADYLDFSTDNPMGPGFLYSKKVKDKIGNYLASYEMISDYEYWIRVIKQFILVRCPQVLCASVDVPYGRRIDRIHVHLFKRYIRYKNGFLTLERLMWAVEDYLDRIKKHAESFREYAGLLFNGSLKLYRISTGAGIIFEILVWRIYTKQNVEPLFASFAVWLRDAKFYFIALRLKKDSSDKNILCVVPGVIFGGSEKVVKDVVDRLKNQGYHFNLLTNMKTNNSWCRNFMSVFENVVLLRKSFNHLNADHDEEYYAYLKFLIQKLNIRILLISNVMTPYRCLEKLKAEFKLLKIVDLLHVDKFIGTSEDTLFAVPFIDERVSISAGLKEIMRGKYQKAGTDLKYMDQIRVIYNANDMAHNKRDAALVGKFKLKYNISLDTKLISYVGRFSVEKRPIVFVDVAKKVLSLLPDEKFKFVMAGDGLYRKAVESRINQHGIADKIVLTGVLNNQEVKELLTDSYLVLITSSIEGLPLVSVEAMSMDVPVISTDVGSVKEAILDGVNGFLVHPQQKIIENFASVIEKLSLSKDLYEKMTKRARNDVHDRFSYDTFERDYNNLFERLLSK